MCFFVGYKYEGGGYRVWDLKRQVVVESRDIIFFEEGLPSPTLNNPPLRPVDEDEQVTPPTLDHNTSPTTPPDAANVPAAPPPYVATPVALPEVTHKPESAPIPLPRITIRLPGRGMIRTVTHTAQAQDKPADIDDEDADGASDEDAVPPVRPIHDVSYVPSYPSKSTRSGLIRNVERALCSSWMKKHILLSLFRPVYQVVFSFPSCPTRVV